MEGDYFMLNQYEICIDENNKRYLQAIAQFNLEDINPNTNNIFEIMNVLNDNLKVGYMETEHIYIIACDYKGGMIGIYLNNIGKYDLTKIDLRTISLFLLLSGAAKFIMVHNHPNNCSDYSQEDLDTTETVKIMGQYIGIELIGSYVLTKDKYTNILTNETKELYYDWSDELC